MTTITPGADRTASSGQAAASSQQNQHNNTILDKDAFLRLLITQLANQDPTNPMEDREFISQMAQFSSLEQMNNIASEMRGLRLMFAMSADLIGKTVEWIVPGDGGNSRTGKVEAVMLRNGEPVIVADGQEFYFDQIIRVSNAHVDDGETPSDDTDGQDGGDSDE